MEKTDETVNKRKRNTFRVNSQQLLNLIHPGQ